MVQGARSLRRCRCVYQAVAVVFFLRAKELLFQCNLHWDQAKSLWEAWALINAVVISQVLVEFGKEQRRPPLSELWDSLQDSLNIAPRRLGKRK